MQELGLSIDYRCPACRSCQGCRNAPETKHISLREEAEDQAIKESVKIDFEKKKITCILPLRGKEEEFLSSNRKSAEKVLDSQCRKVQHDEEAKREIIKSFNKLFDGGFSKKFELVRTTSSGGSTLPCSLFSLSINLIFQMYLAFHICVADLSH